MEADALDMEGAFLSLRTCSSPPKRKFSWLAPPPLD